MGARSVEEHDSHDPQVILQAWSLAVVATNKPGYYEALENAKNGVGDYVPWENVAAG
jgi:hypothetical protein